MQGLLSLPRYAHRFADDVSATTVHQGAARQQIRDATREMPNGPLARTIVRNLARPLPDNPASNQYPSARQSPSTGSGWQQALGLGLVHLGDTMNGGRGLNPNVVFQSMMAQRLYNQRRQDAERAATIEQKQHAGLQQEGQKLGLNPREMFALRNAPDEFMSNYAQRFRPRIVGEGDSLTYGIPGDGGTNWRAPETFEDGPNIIDYDPNNGGARSVYEGSTDAEHYASSLGLQPGTPDYENAVRDYVLRSSGPTAFGYRRSLEGQRQGNRLDLEGVRQGNREALEDRRHTNRTRFREQFPPNTRGRRTGRSTRSATPPARSMTATGPNGQRLRLNPQTNQWEPIN